MLFCYMFTVIFKLSNGFRAKRLDVIQKQASVLAGFKSLSQTTGLDSDGSDLKEVCVYSACFSDEYSRDIFRLILRSNYGIPSLF